MRSPWLWMTLCLGLGVIVAVWGGLSWVEGRRSQRELEQARSDMAGGRFVRAKQRLSELARGRSSSDEAAYQLGVCEEALGHGEAAEKAWSQVPPSSPFAIRAAVGRARILMNRGRL